MLNKIDDYLLDAKYGFQNISDECKKLTGLTNFWIAKWMYICVAILTIFLLIAWFVLTNLSTSFNSIVYLFNPIVYLALSALLISKVYSIFILEIKDKKFAKNNSSVMNEGRINGVGRRVLLLVAVSIFLINFLYLYFFMGDTKLLFEISFIAYFVLQVFYLAGEYFEACTPLPSSGKSKMKKWYEKTLIRIKKRMFEKEDLSGPTFLQ